MTLAPSLSYADALRALEGALRALRDGGEEGAGGCDAPDSPAARMASAAAAASRAPSGIVRVEAPLPAGFDALRWLEALPALRSAPAWEEDAASSDRARSEASDLAPRVYFSPRASRTEPAAFSSARAGGAGWGVHGAVGACGAAALWTADGDFDEDAAAAVGAWLSDRSPRVRALGCTRFDAGTAPAPEWARFGGYYFVVPSVELRECAGATLLTLTVAWDGVPHGGGIARAMGAEQCLLAATARAAAALSAVAAAGAEQPRASAGAPSRAAAQPEGGRVTEQAPCADGWKGVMDETLSRIEDGHVRDTDERAAADGSDALSKVVLARATHVSVDANAEPCALLAELQQRDPTAYQFLLQLKSGETFFGSSPERLYRRVGREVASEAVAATRARGVTDEEDAALTRELMGGKKEHEEFMIVRDDVRRELSEVCSSVEDVVGKEPLKQASIQHLYGVLQGRLREDVSDAHLLHKLHPTPAMCGHPTDLATRAIREAEPFDRGMYAGPFGWLGGEGAEFSVAIRSALVLPESGARTANSTDLAHGGTNNGDALLDRSAGADNGRGGAHVIVYAGVGIVRGACPDAEWAELDLKCSSMLDALTPARGVCADVAAALDAADRYNADADDGDDIRAKAALVALPNASNTWARLAVEELVRLGVTYFCVAPGSRSTPLALAALEHSRATVVPCIDERSLGFHALGYGKASGCPACVITTSGTAVANLAPAVHEASLSCTPLLLLTADRPFELRDCGANQALRAQADVFGDAVLRWRTSVPPPDAGAPASAMLSALSQAVHRSVAPMAGGNGPGAVHVNMEFREPLEPTPHKWDAAGCVSGLRAWATSRAPLTTYVSGVSAPVGGGVGSIYPELARSVLPLLSRARKGLIVAGGALGAEDAWAIISLAKRTGWPVLTDVTSSLRVGIDSGAARAAGVCLVSHFDQTLAEEPLWGNLFPDVVVQFGERPLSKRLAKFLKRGTACGATSARVLVAAHAARLDETHCATHRIVCTASAFVAATDEVTPGAAGATERAGSNPRILEQMAFTSLWSELSGAASRAVDLWLASHESDAHRLTEMRVAVDIVEGLPERNALFLGNSMPIRDADMFGESRGHHDGHLSTGAPVCANRGASGIDGLVSSTVGYAAGTGLPTTLVIGDVSFMHDTNGLSMLRERPNLPPVAVVVINNGGGRIFDFLPVSSTVSEGELTQLFRTPPDTAIGEICAGMRVLHSVATTRADLSRALVDLRRRKRHGVVEVVVDGEANRLLHAELQCAVRAAVRGGAIALGLPGAALATGAASTMLAGGFGMGLAPTASPGLAIAGAECERYVIPTAQNLTTGAKGGVRTGILLKVELECGASGVGDIAPLEGLHAAGEDINSVQAQALALCAALCSSRGSGSNLCLPARVALLDGSLHAWLSAEPAVRPEDLYPSVRFGLETALLAALAQARGLSVGELVAPAFAMAAPAGAPRGPPRQTAAVRTAALLPAVSTAEEARNAVEAAVAQGYDRFKLKVGRGLGAADARRDGEAAAAAVSAAQALLGASRGARAVRVDANQRWSTEEYASFVDGLGESSLEYVEEPLSWQPLMSALLEDSTSDSSEDDVMGPMALDGVAPIGPAERASDVASAQQPPLALDERACVAIRGAKDACGVSNAVAALVASSGAAALVLKPSVIGGVESTAAAARGAAAAGARTVYSAAFESRAGVSAIAALACATDSAEPDSVDAESITTHGLGTGSFLDESDLWDADSATLESPIGGAGEGVHITAAASEPYMRALPDRSAPLRPVSFEDAVRWEVPIPGSTSADTLVAHDYGEPGASRTESEPAPLVVLLHGFLGDARDWQMVAAALSPIARVVAVDLPGHGAATQAGGADAGTTAAPVEELSSIEAVADAVAEFVERVANADADAKGRQGERRVVLAGYSMGGRVALSSVSRHPELFDSLVAVSASAGIEGRPDERARRHVADGRLARKLEHIGAKEFLSFWYDGPLWAPLRDAAGGRLVERLVERRGSALSGNEAQLARALEGMSVGRMEPCSSGVAAACATHNVRLSLLAGARDRKYVAANRRLLERVAGAFDGGAPLPHAEAHVVPGVGHALLTEAPETVVEWIRQAL